MFNIWKQFRRQTMKQIGADLSYLSVARNVIDKIHDLRDYGMEPKYIVLGYKNYLELMFHVSTDIKQRPTSMKKFMGCEVVVIPGKDMIEVVPDLVEFAGVRTS